MRMRFAWLACLAVQSTPVGARIGTSVPCLLLRVVAIGGFTFEMLTFANLLRSTCELLCGRSRCSTADRGRFEFACSMIEQPPFPLSCLLLELDVGALSVPAVSANAGGGCALTMGGCRTFDEKAGAASPTRSEVCCSIV